MAELFDFWNDHSETFLKMAYLYDRHKVVEHPDGYGTKTGDCGDTITLYLLVEDGCVDQVFFDLQGCLNTNACCNALADLVEGKKLAECWEVTPEDIIGYLETLPDDHHHCAELTVGTFYLALTSYAAKQEKIRC